MIEARDLFETHLTVRNLDVAIDFYRDIVGLTLAHVTRGRQAAFLWIGSAGKAMLGLWVAGSAPQAVTLHTAFRVSVADVLAAPRLLLDAGVTPLDFDGRPTDLPVVLAWMPAAAVYFRDPDGHLLEYIAMLLHEPRPDCGVVPWRTWELMQSAPTHLLSSSKTRPIELDPTCPVAMRRPCASDQPAMQLITKSGLDQPSTLSSGACGCRRRSDDGG
jgi:lactoylglutathione lyase